MKEAHYIETEQQGGAIVYVCEQCGFQRKVDILTGVVEIVNHGDKDAIHVADGISFEYTADRLKTQAT